MNRKIILTLTSAISIALSACSSPTNYHTTPAPASSSSAGPVVQETSSADNDVDDVSDIDDLGAQTYITTLQMCLKEHGELADFRRDENSVPKSISDTCYAEADKATEWHPSRPEGVPYNPTS